MFGPTRGGTRGGQAEFSWDQVRGDQHRENYLGHSVQAPTGRWQNGRDVNWYNKEDGSATQEDEDARKAARRAELMEIKAREEEEMNKRLGIKSGILSTSASGPGKALLEGSAPVNRAGTGSNTAPLANSRWGGASSSKPADGADEDRLTKEDKKLARKLAKDSVRQAKHDEKVRVRAERAERRAKRDAEGGSARGSRSRHSDDDDDRRRRDSSSRYRDEERAKVRERSSSRYRDEREREPSHHSRRHYDDERERERPRPREDEREAWPLDKWEAQLRDRAHASRRGEEQPRRRSRERSPAYRPRERSRTPERRRERDY